MRNIKAPSGTLIPFPNRALEGDAAVLALASILIAGKRSQKALARCEKRMLRAVARIEAASVAPSPLAVMQLRRACASCGGCSQARI